MEKAEFKICEMQLTIFTPNIFFKKNKILKDIMESYSDKFDGDIISIPVPDDAPKEIPRVILSDNIKRYRFEIAESRTNFRIFSRETFEIESNLKLYLNFYFQLIDKYIKSTNAIIGRIGVVINKIIEKENSANFLVKYFLNKSFLENIHFHDLNNFELNFRKIISLNKINVNSWVRCKNSKEIVRNKKRLDSILVMQDINTLSEELEQKNYSIKNLEEFVKIALDKHSEILKEIFFEGID